MTPVDRIISTCVKCCGILLLPHTFIADYPKDNLCLGDHKIPNEHEQVMLHGLPVCREIMLFRDWRVKMRNKVSFNKTNPPKRTFLFFEKAIIIISLT